MPNHFVPTLSTVACAAGAAVETDEAALESAVARAGTSHPARPRAAMHAKSKVRTIPRLPCAIRSSAIRPSRATHPPSCAREWCTHDADRLGRSADRASRADRARALLATHHVVRGPGSPL